MTVLWPRLPRDTADEVFEEVSRGVVHQVSSTHPGQTWAEVGTRVAPSSLDALRAALLEAAAGVGFPGRRPGREERRAFDHKAAAVVRAGMDVTYAEASSADVWAFVALVLLPDLTAWRWSNEKTLNRERWIFVDVTRHTWSRCWWLAEGFGDHLGLMSRFKESEIDQLFERHSIGSRPRLLRAVAPLLAAAYEDGRVPRRLLTREVGKRLVRQLAYIDPHALTDDQLGDWCLGLVATTSQQILDLPDDSESVDET